MDLQVRKAGGFLKVEIYSKDKIERLLDSSDRLENKAVISFYDPPSARGERAMPVDYRGKADTLFQVAVNDIDLEVLPEYGLTFETFFTEAEELAEFISEAYEKGMDIICQCEYGQSRSAACAAAILEFYEKNGISIFADYRYYPNQLIFNKVLDSLRRIS